MAYLADLHIHSHFSLATSKTATLTGLAAWAGVKGIDLVATGDFTHPGWFAELGKQLQPAEPGFYILPNTSQPAVLPGLIPHPHKTRFLISAEVSCIYRKNGKTRKIHCLLFTPDLISAGKINHRLAAYGKLASDGRPTLKLDVRNLLEIVLEQAPESFLVPAHIWTPWFSLFGSRSGFDSIEECFEDLSDHIFALETGLSSDPAMNRCISSLDRFSLISNSDCHSPARLGREANIFSGPFDYFSLRNALENQGQGLSGTIEFFPQEGKYYADGHRRCRSWLDEATATTSDDLCPVCRKHLTTGVKRRVNELADRLTPYFPADSPTIHHLVGLQEIIAEITGRGQYSKTVRDYYVAAINRLGPEIPLLLGTSTEEISSFSPLLATAVDRVRRGRVIKECGFDGQPGQIRIFSAKELLKMRPPYFSW